MGRCATAQEYYFHCMAEREGLLTTLIGLGSGYPDPRTLDKARAATQEYYFHRMAGREGMLMQHPDS